MLHQPDIFAALDGSGRLPHRIEPPGRDRTPEPGIGRPKQRDGRAPGRRREVSNRSVRPDKEPGAGQQVGQLSPGWLAVAADYVREAPPYQIEISALRRGRSARCDDLQSARAKV